MNSSIQGWMVNPEKGQVSVQIGVKLKEVEKVVIIETLRSQRFNRTKTASVLGIGIRTLQRKLKQYAMQADHSPQCIAEE